MTKTPNTKENNMEKYIYDTNVFDFHDTVADIFGVNNLSKLHEEIKYDKEIPDDPSKDQKTSFHKIFYASYEDEDNEILPLYRQFVKHLKKTHFTGREVIYQTRPTFRVHAPNNIAVAKWHKDKSYNHSSNEINIFLPVTNAFGTNTIWAESQEDKGDYSPMNADYGEYYIWNGANLLHGNKQNTTNVSRVSFDFRIIFAENFSYEGTSVTHKMEMTLGKYWSKI